MAEDRAPSPLEGWSRADLAARIDHTVLQPEADQGRIEVAVAVAVSNGCAAVCVQPTWVQYAVEMVGGRIPVCAVVGFPHGASLTRTKADEAAAVVALGAEEVDVVADLAALADDDLGSVAADVADVRAAVPATVLKVILETALWTPALVRAAAEAAVAGGADYVKTSTGFHPAGGATLEAVAALHEGVAGRARVKASGGIRTLAQARAMLDAGADRLGLSATESVLAELTGR